MDINTLSNAALAPAATPITTGASPTAADPTVRYYEVTSGGTADVEVLDLPSLSLPIDGSYNTQMIGSRIIIALTDQTDPGDRVKITVDGSSTLSIYPGSGTDAEMGIINFSNVFLDFLGAAISFVWCGDTWMLDPVSDSGFSVDDPAHAIISAPVLYVTNQPTTDPSSGGQLWVDNGVLRLSGTGIIANQGVVRRAFYQDFAATFGAISAFIGNIETVSVTGLLTTDQVHVECIDSPPSGMIIANSRVSAADTLELYITTAVGAGITLGALNFRVTVIR